jgi:hypothetical protein
MRCFSDLFFGVSKRVAPLAVKNRLKGTCCYRETKGAGGVPFDKRSGTTVPPLASVRVACVSVLLLFAVEDNLEFGRNDPGLCF